MVLGDIGLQTPPNSTFEFKLRRVRSFIHYLNFHRYIASAPFDMDTRSKRKHEEVDDPEEFTAAYVCNLIRQLGNRSVGEFILEMAQSERLTAKDIKAMMEKLPAFASADWETVAVAFGLDPSSNQYHLQPFSTPHARLPPSFHRRVMREAIQWLDVYQERASQKREAARVRLMDAVCFRTGFLPYELTISFSGTSPYALYSKVA